MQRRGIPSSFLRAGRADFPSACPIVRLLPGCHGRTTRGIRAQEEASLATTYDVVAVLAQAISQRIGEPRYNLWFQGKTKFICKDNLLTIGVPNLFLQDWLQKK